jgi:hypothetical protein
MPKPRKMLTDCDAHIVSLMRLIETQSKVTIANWCVSYADAHLLPVWEKTFPDDDRPRAALQAARDWLEGRIKLPVAKKGGSSSQWRRRSSLMPMPQPEKLRRTRPRKPRREP